MCGICGFTWNDATKIDAMVASLRHRGPDANGTYLSKDVSVGHTRLKVIDLSEAASQPMAADDESVVVAFNGEIYNFTDLRVELEHAGAAFKSASDTEVLLRGYMRWGHEIFSRMNGMWAVCIYDRRHNRIVLSRDRMGVKPLYYMLPAGNLVFASEPRAILHHVSSPTADPIALDLLLSSQFVPSPRTLFKDISKLEPGHILTFDLETRATDLRPYYEIPRYAPEYDRAALLDEGRRLLADAVRIRLVSDVPVGAFLSGGLDSTVVVSRMREEVGGPNLHTVSVGFDIPGLDESEYIHLARRRFSTTHHHLEFATSDVPATLEQISGTTGEIVADPSMLPSYKLCQEAKRWMTVSLSGDGADEVFAGYPSRQAIRLIARLKRVPRIVRRVLHAAARSLLGYSLTGLGRITEALRVSLLPDEDCFGELGATCMYRPPAFKRWAKDRISHLLRLTDGNLLEAVLKFDLHYNRLPDNYCMKVDGMSMAHALEVRSPFLDYRFAEFAAKIPTTWKIGPRGTKLFMREMVSDLVPERILNREKHGFAAPLGVWADSNRSTLRRAIQVMHEDEALSVDWVQFFRDIALDSDEPIHREFRKRLMMLWSWYSAWIRNDAEAQSTT